MNKVSRQQEIKMRQQVSPWMDARKLPLVLYDKLKPYNKVKLHNIVCIGTTGHSDGELRGLYVDLGLLSEARAGDHEPTYEELKEYFSPRTIVGNVPYQKMF